MSERSPFPAAKRIVFTGRLASMSRSAAVEQVVRGGGSVLPRVSRNTDLIVIGADGWPLQSSGRLTRNLERAEMLEKAGVLVEIVGEAEFMQRLRGYREVETVRSTYTLEQLSRLLGVSGLRLRNWIQQGLIRPSSHEGALVRFDYSDVAAAMSVAKLVRRGISPATMVRSLSKLSRWLPQDSRVAAQVIRLQNQLLVRDRNNQLIESNGQYWFVFDDAEADRGPLSGNAPRECFSAIDADRLFDTAYQQEIGGRAAEAIAQYNEWLARFGEDGAVLFNLANVYLHTQQLVQASDCYRRCLRQDPRRSAAWNNLGLCLARREDLSGAIKALRKALELDAGYTDARYNLADILDEAGCAVEARLAWLVVVRHQPAPELLRYAHARIAALTTACARLNSHSSTIQSSTSTLDALHSSLP